MGKRKNRQIQQSAHMRGYRAAMKEVHSEIDDISNAVYSIRLMIETSRVITLDDVSDKLEVIQERLTELSDTTLTRSNKGRKPSILDLQNGINISSIEDEPLSGVDDNVVEFLLEKEFEDKDADLD